MIDNNISKLQENGRKYLQLDFLISLKNFPCGLLIYLPKTGSESNSKIKLLTVDLKFIDAIFFWISSCNCILQVVIS